MAKLVNHQVSELYNVEKLERQTRKRRTFRRHWLPNASFLSRGKKKLKCFKRRIGHPANPSFPGDVHSQFQEACLQPFLVLCWRMWYWLIWAASNFKSPTRVTARHSKKSADSSDLWSLERSGLRALPLMLISEFKSHQHLHREGARGCVSFWFSLMSASVFLTVRVCVFHRFALFTLCVWSSAGGVDKAWEAHLAVLSPSQQRQGIVAGPPRFDQRKSKSLPTSEELFLRL